MTKPAEQTSTNEPDETTAEVEEDTSAEAAKDESSGDEQQETDEAASEDEAGDEGSEEEGGDELPDWAREKLTKANAEAANYRTKLRDMEAKFKEASDKLVELGDADKQATEAANALRPLLVENVALKYKLPAKLQKRLVGETREELEADAKELAAEFAADDDELHLSGGLSPRNRDSSAGLGPRELASKHAPRRRR